MKAYKIDLEYLLEELDKETLHLLLSKFLEDFKDYKNIISSNSNLKLEKFIISLRDFSSYLCIDKLQEICEEFISNTKNNIQELLKKLEIELDSVLKYISKINSKYFF